MSQTMANLVDVRGVSFSRANRLIFDDISLTVPRGKITAIMGPSGIGKTTLLRDIARQLSNGFSGFDGVNVAIADERSEIAVKSSLTAKTSPRCHDRACILFVNA